MSDHLYFATALVCHNGHVATSLWQGDLQDADRYCAKCGERVIGACEGCATHIRGGLVSMDDDGDLLVHREMTPLPNFCTGCSCPFPWTRKSLEAAQELADLELVEADAAIVRENLNDVVCDTPRTKVAALKLRKAFASTGPAAWGMFRDITVDILSEAARKALFGP